MSLPAISVTGIQGDLLSWRCDSGCWFPEPEMSWLDSDGNIITAGPSVTEKPSDHCYVVQRTVTVALTENVTCRVHLPHINHTVETHSVKAGNEHHPLSSVFNTLRTLSTLHFVILSHSIRSHMLLKGHLCILWMSFGAFRVQMQVIVVEWLNRVMEWKMRSHTLYSVLLFS